VPRPTLTRLGDHAWLVEYEPRVDVSINARVLRLAARIRDQRWPDVVDVVPAYASLAVHLSPECPDPDRIERHLSDLIAHDDEAVAQGGRLIEIPVVYGAADGPDLDDVARVAGISADEVVRRHVAVTYRVFMLGFLPGFPYLGIVDPVIQVARRPAPRTRVPAGSVGLAGAQTGIYPRESPGGWQIIGRTEAWLFDVNERPPTRLLPGDDVVFVPVRARS
jgi:KipI family sensor histidine kinase inhibitor